MTLIVAGERSGVGKTTVTLALLSFLAQRNLPVQSFKVGPDYIDPMFHTAVTGRPCRNLDPVLTSEAYIQHRFACHGQGIDYALIEGVMGLFDGVLLESQADYGSTAHIARLLNVPVLLVIDCRRLSGSVAAIAHGYRSFDPRIAIAGVVLNRVGSDRHLELLQQALEPLDLPILGILRRQEQIAIPDRHLGLVPTAELDGLSQRFGQLAELAKSSFVWERLLPLLEVKGENNPNCSSQILFPKTTNGRNVKSSFPRPPVPPSPHQSQIVLDRADLNSEVDFSPPTSRVEDGSNTPIPIAIARDRAFNFYYPDNLDLLEKLGAKLIPWSPMVDESLPSGIRGLYFGGGFPEVFAAQLAANQKARSAVRAAILAGMPTYAECGGLMYLCEQLVDFAGKSWSMVGVIPGTTTMGDRLTLGYRRATALSDSPILVRGETVWGHEFHRSELPPPSAKPLFTAQSLQRDRPCFPEGWNLPSLHASYIHLHWGVYPLIPQRFIQHCLNFLVA